MLLCRPAACNSVRICRMRERARSWTRWAVDESGAAAGAPDAGPCACAANAARSPASNREMRERIGEARRGTTPESYQRPFAEPPLRRGGHRLERTRGDRADRMLRAFERLGLRRISHREALGVDELHVLDAEEAQEVANVSRLRVERRARVEAAARGEDVGFL